MNKKILIIEDEVPIRKFTSINLVRNNYEVLEAGSGEEGLDILNNEFVDLILLDVMLPGMNGFETCEAIRKINPKVPIIMLTAKGQDQDKIHGFQSGGDDYVVKPFNPIELVARINAILKRFVDGDAYHAGYIQSHGYSINLRTREAFKNGVAIDLTQREFRLLSLLIDNAGIAISRDEIMDRVWHDVVTEPKTIDVYIRRLRGKIEENPAKPERIETVWGIGYRWRK
ncbi:MAG: response regulator transcription factor [Caldisericia bacterium]|nr:response regulator transcription factor [Caldisericia bacterium]MDD4614960.1 response regulator transcription factor [Caldisericia bacterium]